MIDYFNFPEQFRVNKKLGKKRFLNNPNLMPSERKRLAAYMEQIEILYDITFGDKSEIVVMYSVVSLSDFGQEHFVSNYVKAIKQSIPYKCLLGLYCEGVAQFFVFDEHSNSRNIDKTVVDGIYSTMGFILKKDNWIMLDLMNNLKNSILASHSANELYGKWKNVVAKPWYAGPLEDILYMVEEANECKDRKLRYELALENCSGCCSAQKTQFDDVESDLFYGTALDFKNEVSDSLFLDFCKTNCRKLYNEACEFLDINEELWLKDYIAACNEYANDELNKSFDSECVSAVVNAFRNETEEPDDYCSVNFYEEYLKAKLYSYFSYGEDDSHA